MAYLSNSMRQNRKERPNRSTNNRDVAELAIRYVVREGVSEKHPSLKYLRTTCKIHTKIKQVYLTF